MNKAGWRKDSGLAGERQIVRLNWLRILWRIVRELSGDDAYERYLRHNADKHPHVALLSRKAFWKQEQARKWNGVRRCC